MSEKRKGQPMTFLERVDKWVDSVCFHDSTEDLTWFGHAIIIVCCTVFSLVLILAIVAPIWLGTLFMPKPPTPAEKYNDVFIECLAFEQLSEIQCNDIALESID